MLHRVLAGSAAALYVFAVAFGVLTPLVWHPFKLATDADYSREHQQRGVALRRGDASPDADAERRIRLDELRRLRRALTDAGVARPALLVLDARARGLQERGRGPTEAMPPAPMPSARSDPVAANARRFLWAVAAASLASVLLAIDGYLNARGTRRTGRRNGS
jgi:hypothetical protein